MDSKEEELKKLPSEQPALVVSDGEANAEYVDRKQREQAELNELVRLNLGHKYEVVSLLGRGGMGAVYKVRHKLLDKIFAVKVLNPDLLKDRASLKRFDQEAHAASKLTHPNLAAVYDYGKGDAGAPFIVMDYLEGKSLDKILEDEVYLAAPRAVDLFVQATEAVAHAHQKGVIHRDIKPANLIIMQQDGIEMVKLVDFGIAKVLTEDSKITHGLTQTGEIFGSPTYMSPEQCQGLKLDARSDIYALGCVMYETLTGSPPFTGDNPIQTILKHISDLPPRFGEKCRELDISQDFEAIVMLCLAKDPEQRYQSMDELRRDLVMLRDGRKVKFKKSKSIKKMITSVAQPEVKLKATVNSGALKPGRTQRLLIFGLTAMIVSAVMFWAFNQAGSQQQPLLSLSGNPSNDERTTDGQAFVYFSQGKYELAAPLIEFGIKAYEEKVKETGDPMARMYLADNYQHRGKCSLMMAKYADAAPYYRKAIETYLANPPRYRPMFREAITDYARVLRHLKRSAEADAMTAEFSSTGKLRNIP